METTKEIIFNSSTYVSEKMIKTERRIRDFKVLFMNSMTNEYSLMNKVKYNLDITEELIHICNVALIDNVITKIN